jgi:hypothetical protein
VRGLPASGGPGRLFRCGIYAGWKEAGGRLCPTRQQKSRFCRDFTGVPALEPATSGVTGRSWRFRLERGLAGIPAVSRGLPTVALRGFAGLGGSFRRAPAGYVRDTGAAESGYTWWKATLPARCCLERRTGVAAYHCVPPCAVAKRRRIKDPPPRELGSYPQATSPSRCRFPQTPARGVPARRDRWSRRRRDPRYR